MLLFYLSYFLLGLAVGFGVTLATALISRTQKRKHQMKHVPPSKLSSKINDLEKNDY